MQILTAFLAVTGMFMIILSCLKCYRGYLMAYYGLLWIGTLLITGGSLASTETPEEEKSRDNH